MTRALRCAACTRRIRGSHARVGLIDYESGKEITYHAHPNCQKRGVQDMAALLEALIASHTMQAQKLSEG